MTNSSNFTNNSQYFPQDPERKKIFDSLHRLSESELAIVKYSDLVKRGICSDDVERLIGLSESASACTLRRLSDPQYNKRLITGLMDSSRSGPRGTLLYFLKREVLSEDIQTVMEERRFDYEKYISQCQRNNISDSFEKGSRKQNTEVLQPLPNQATSENISQNTAPNTTEEQGQDQFFTSSSSILIAIKEALAERDVKIQAQDAKIQAQDVLIQKLQQEIATLRQEQKELVRSFLKS